jgi:cell division protein FtsW
MIRALRLPDPTLFFLAALLTLLGLFFIFDAGYPRSLLANKGVIPREFWMQMIFAPVAIFASFLFARARPKSWQKWSKAIWILTILSLLAVMIPGVGIERSGAHRWINLRVIEIQPAEFAKLGAILYLAGVLAVRKQWPKQVKAPKSFAQRLDTVWVPKVARWMPAVWVLGVVVLIEREPDLGTAAVIAATGFCMFAFGGATRKSVVAALIIGIAGAGFLAKQQPYRMERITSHSQRWSTENMDDTGYQTVQSELGMATGGVLGTGIGSGRAKHVLPATTTDFIAATVGEEFGLLGMLGLVGLLGAVVVRLIRLSAKAPSAFARHLLIGVACWIGIQSCVNIMMANGTLPAIGIPLPFISSGGSSLIALWVALGVCQSVLQPQTEKEEADAPGHHRRWNRRPRLSRA